MQALKRTTLLCCLGARTWEARFDVRATKSLETEGTTGKEVNVQISTLAICV